MSSATPAPRPPQPRPGTSAPPPPANPDPGVRGLALSSPAWISGFSLALFFVAASICLAARCRKRAAAAGGGRTRARPSPSPAPAPAPGPAYPPPAYGMAPVLVPAYPRARHSYPSPGSPHYMYGARGGGGGAYPLPSDARGYGPPPSLEPVPTPPAAPELTTFTATESQRETPCSICLEPFGREPLAAGACAHMFHAACVAAWLAKDANRSCPVCRMPFEGEPGMVPGEAGADEGAQHGAVLSLFGWTL